MGHAEEEEEEKPKKKKKKQEEEEEYVHAEEEEEEKPKKKKKKHEEEEEEVEEDAPKKKAKAKGKKGKVEEEDEQEEEPEPSKKPNNKDVASKSKGKKGQANDEEEEVQEDKKLDFQPPARADEPDAQEELDGGKHKEFIIAQVASVEPMKKKGQFLTELSVGEDKPKLNVVTSFTGVEVDQLVIVAPEGATVNGKKVKSAKVGGEFNEGVIISPAEMPDFPGDKNEHIVLPESFAPGERAPLCPPGASTKATAKSKAKGAD